jgi:uncharacterized protein involved in exopolysaccharide biosynthesis
LREVVQIVLEQPDAELSNLMAQSDVAQENLIKMAASYSSDHPNYITARKLIEEIDRRIDARVEGILIGLQTKLDKTRATLSALSERLENARTNDLAMAERTRPYFMRHEQLIDLLEFKKNLQTRLANMKADLSLPRPTPVEIIDRAASPLQPLSNNQSLGLGLVILGGLLGCVGIVMMRRKSEESLT